MKYPTVRILAGRSRQPLVLSLFLLALVAVGCDSGSGSSVTPPTKPTLFSRLWPNADGNRWSFDYQRHQSTTPMIPELEGLAELAPEEINYHDLEERLTGDLPEPGVTEAIGVANLYLDGTIASLDGRKQKLVSELIPITNPPAARERANPSPAFRATDAVSPLMARIYRGRPDLRARMVALGYVPAGYEKTSAPQEWPPFSFLGSKFEKQANWIGLYGDLSADSSYTMIQGPLEEGRFFRHQLVPDLADDIWEYGWILGPRAVETPAGRFDDAIGIVYFLDFGRSIFVDEQGQEGVSFRSYSIVSFYLAPDVGPVYQRAIDYLSPPIPEINIQVGILFSEASLRESDVR